MQLLKTIASRALSFEESLNVLRYVGSDEDPLSLFHLMQYRNNLDKSLTQILDSILVERGFYPYVENLENLKGSQGLACEFHRSEHIPFIFHREQRKVLSLLSDLQSVVLCAPTSFGKSLLIEEIVASGRYNNIVVIQPTLALLDETRKKLKSYTDYKTIFSKSQKPGERNIYLLTAERFTEFPTEIDVNFFVIDEFYKLDLESPDRRDILNLAFYKLLKKTNCFYLLGPQVKLNPKEISERARCEVVQTDFNTVTNETSFVGEKTIENLTANLKYLDGQSLVYTSSPGSAEEIAAEINKNLSFKESSHEDFISWCSTNVHANWSLYESLRNGIGFHHAQMPRYVGNYIVEAFNKGTIRVLICTSTLMEGVNTSAKNVLIYDLKKGKSKMTSLDLRNISGRAGRMKKHFVGKVLVFSKELKLKEPELKIPSIDTTHASDELIIQISESDLPESMVQKRQEILNNSVVPADILKKNAGISIESQLKLFNTLNSLSNEDIQVYIWNGPPDWNELEAICKLIFSTFKRSQDGLIRTGRQLAFFVDLYRRSGSSAAVINHLVSKSNEPVDKAIRETFGRIRGWFEFRLPKLLLTTQEIVELVAARKGVSTKGMDYTFFAAALENGFLPPSIGSLRELGIPAELLKKLSNRVDMNADPEDLISTLKRLALESDLHPFESVLIKDL